MADILSSLQKMNDLEISSSAALAESLFLKIGANINGLIDRNNRTVTFTASGSWTCPSDVTRVTLLGAGGGGGGGYSTSDGNIRYGGAGGGGSVPLSAVVSVVPNTNYTVTIGVGGAGGYINLNPLDFFQGQPGGTTSFGSIARFAGAAGTTPNSNTANTLPPPYLITPLLTQTGGGFGSNSGGTIATVGQPSVSALGGLIGNQGNGGQAGAGGGAGYGPGGNGGNGTNNLASSSAGQPGGISAGGGGGGFVFDNGTGILPGGKGGNGILVISY